MPKIPVNMNTTEFLVENLLIEPKPRRDYLGMSSLGNKCLRHLFYSFHWASFRPKVPIRKQRIFDRGDIEEARIIADLVRAGLQVFRLDEMGNEIPMTGELGEEQEELVGFAGHSAGHPDGRVRGLPESKKVHLLEMKSAKASKWAEFKKHGVKKANPVYYAQMQRYMPEMGLDRALFIVTNKDTEERHYERVRLEQPAVAELKRKEMIIITSESPPERISNNSNWIDCKWCDDRDICHGKKVVEKNCRTCAFVDIEDNGKWRCGNKDCKPKFNKELSKQDQMDGSKCNHYKVGWGL